MRICVAFPTFRRPEGLIRALRSLASLKSVAGVNELLIAVFDNDASSTAENICATEANTLGLTYHYEAVPEKGLAYVRNAILAFAAGRFDYLAMLDDDEESDELWLSELVDAMRATGAAAVFGRVETLFPENSSAWVHTFRESEYPLLKNHSVLSDGWTSNCLLDLQNGAVDGVRFDLALNFAGGEDQLYFRTIIARGGVLRYAENAVVSETLPVDRTRPLAVLRRSFRRGNSLAISDRMIHHSWNKMTLRSLKAVFIIGKAMICVLGNCIRLRFNAAMVSAIEGARGVGMIAGCVGFTYEAYK